jgi:DNA-binding LacI/PurR family transcriptional regulator
LPLSVRFNASYRKEWILLATIEDVAKACGVSKSTVSNVFSKKLPISREVTERVLAAAKELNYRPNYWARSLAMKSTRIIGLKIRGENLKFSQFHLSLLNGVLRVCYDHGYRLLVNTLSPAYLNQVEHLASDPVDGEILLDPEIRDSRIEESLRNEVPVVLIGRPDKTYETIVSYVDNDNVYATKQAVHHLLSLGHRDILFLNAPLGRTVTEDREFGFHQAFREAGFEPLENRVVYKPDPNTSSVTFGYETALAMIRSDPAITAVVADSDKMALGVYQAAKSLNLRIPEDLSVFAFSDDTVFSQEFTPPLTGMRLHPERLGEEAANLLIDQIQAKTKVSKRTLIASEPVYRGSCAKRRCME